MNDDKNILIGFWNNGVGGIDQYILELIKTLQKKNFNIALVSQYDDPQLPSAYRQCKVKFYRVHSLKKPLLQYREFCAIYEQEHFDIAYFNISEATNCMGIIAAYHCHVENVIVHSHSSGIDVRNPVKRELRWFIHSLAKHFVIPKCATNFITCSSAATKWMFTGRALKCQPAIMIYNSIDLEKYKFDPDMRNCVRRKLNLENKFVIGSVGSFSYQKNNQFFLQLMRELKKIKKNCVFLSIGAGPEYKQFQKALKDENLEKSFVLLGQRKDVPDLLQAMDVFVLPSRFEGLPFSAIEAEANGLYVILSNHIAKEARLTSRCYFADFNDVHDWINKIVKLQSNERILLNPEFKMPSVESQIVRAFKDFD